MDGELIAGSGTKEDFNLLRRHCPKRQGALAYALFDLLHLDGVDVAAAPLLGARRSCRNCWRPSRHLASALTSKATAEAYRLAGEQHFEGIISKRADRGYHLGRSDDWRKTKQLASDEFAVVGYGPKGDRSGFGSLLLASPTPNTVGSTRARWAPVLRRLDQDVSKRIQGEARSRRPTCPPRTPIFALPRGSSRASWWRCSIAASGGSNCCAKLLESRAGRQGSE